MESLKRIPLSEIDVSDETFSVNFMPDLKLLRSSIRTVGLIQPLLLRKKENRYQIVCGFRRTMVLQELGSPAIEARIFEEGEIQDLKLFFISLHENLTSRGFKVVEKAMAIERMVHHFKIDPGVVTHEFLPLLSLETNEKILKTFLALARMEEPVKRYVLEQEVSRSNIRRLSSLSADDRKAILALLIPLKLGENSLRETLTLVEEIAKRDRRGIHEIARLPEIEAVLSHPELTAPQKTEKVKKVLMDLRYPKMRRLEEQFENARRELNLPSAISLSHSAFFEGKGLSIRFQFESIEEYQSILSSLSCLSGREAFKEILERRDEADKT